MAKASEVVLTGKIEAKNDRGIKIDGRWVNFSTFGDLKAEFEQDPFIDESTELTVTASEAGWIKSFALATAAPVAKQVPVTRPAAQAPLLQAPTAPITKDELIARHVALKSACMFYSGTNAPLKAILQAAEEFQAWTMRGLL